MNYVYYIFLSFATNKDNHTFSFSKLSINKKQNIQLHVRHAKDETIRVYKDNR